MPTRLIETIVTKPSPSDAKNGRTLHWREARALTIMEARRAQGFRDHEVLLGLPSVQFRIVGNSVAKEAAVALGAVFREAWAGSLADERRRGQRRAEMKPEEAQVLLVADTGLPTPSDSDTTAPTSADDVSSDSTTLAADQVVTLRDDSSSGLPANSHTPDPTPPLVQCIRHQAPPLQLHHGRNPNLQVAEEELEERIACPDHEESICSPRRH